MIACLNLDGDIVKEVNVTYSPTEYLVVSKALNLLSEDEEVHELDRLSAKEMLDVFRKEFKNDAKELQDGNKSNIGAKDQNR